MNRPESRPRSRGMPAIDTHRHARENGWWLGPAQRLHKRFASSPKIKPAEAGFIRCLIAF
jgi:hypothetical protein